MKIDEHRESQALPTNSNYEWIQCESAMKYIYFSFATGDFINLMLNFKQVLKNIEYIF